MRGTPIQFFIEDRQNPGATDTWILPVLEKISAVVATDKDAQVLRCEWHPPGSSAVSCCGTG